MVQQTKRAARIALGAVLILVGLVLMIPFVPGPGFVLIFFGLGLLSHEFEWARRWRERMHHGFRRLTGRGSDGPREGAPRRASPEQERR